MDISTENDSDKKNQEKYSELDSHRGWTKDRLHADVQKAVGGVANLVRETARACEQIDHTISADWIIKRLQFYSYELGSLVQSVKADDARLKILNEFFFNAKGFRCQESVRADAVKSPSRPYFSASKAAPENDCAILASFHLGRVLYKREGSPEALELIYYYLADSIGLALDFVDLKPTSFLRWRRDGQSGFIDITRKGKILSCDELLETLQNRFQMAKVGHASLLEAISFENFIAGYLQKFRTSRWLSLDPEKLLKLQNILISYQPSDLHLVAERALLFRQLGNLKSALADLKRYFAFLDRKHAPREVIRVFDELMETLEKKPSAPTPAD